MIEIENVTRSYGDKTAVKNLSLTIPAGELFAFLGPNGAGKTTTIKMLVSLLRPDKGTVKICGKNVVQDPLLANAHTGYVPDQPYLYDDLTGREFMQFVAEMYNLSPEESAAQIQKQIETFGLEDFVDHLAKSYSHGMKQRLVFGSALLHSPDVLIVDEPMVGLDPRSMRLVKDLLREQAKNGATVFMSTHTLSVAEEIADRIGVFNHGELLFLGPISELRKQLADDDGSLEHLFLTITGANDAPSTEIVINDYSKPETQQ